MKFPHHLKVLKLWMMGFFFVSSSLLAQDLGAKARELRLWEDPIWWRLLHYKKGLLGGVESEADGPGFFLHTEGKKNPEAELRTNVEKLFASIHVSKGAAANDDVRCRFPARRKFLAQKLGIEDNFDTFSQCPRLADFWNITRPKSVSVIFSSYFLANPSSAFGHSFLRLNRYPVPAPLEIENPKILDLGVNFAAVVDTNNPLIYGWAGMFGGFKGIFSTTPYYMKVREYADFESRDLWEYDLSLTEAQTQMLVFHIWELDSTHFNYYFLFENCSYHSLTALDVVDEKLNLQDRVPFYVIPVDTIKALYEVPGLVAKVHYRPSLRTQFEARKEEVPAPLRGWILDVEEDPSITVTEKFQRLDSTIRRKIVDAALEHFDSKNQAEIQAKSNSGVLKRRIELLGARAKEEGSSEELVIHPKPGTEPHFGHESLRWGLGVWGAKNSAPRLAAELRFALHDALDSPQGYAPTSTLEFFHLKISANQNKIVLDEFRAIAAESYAPYNKYHKDNSYSAKLGFGDFSGTKICKTCSATFADGAWGWSVALLDDLKFFVMGSGDLLLGPQTKGLWFFNMGLGPKVGWVWSAKHFRTRADLTLKYRPGLAEPWVWSHRIAFRFNLSKSAAFDMETSVVEGSEQRLKASLCHYF